MGIDMEKLEISVNLDGKEIAKRSLSDDLKVDEDHINTCLIQNPGKTAYWNALYQVTKSRVEKQEVAVAQYQATLDKTLRTTAKASGNELKESEIKALILLDPTAQQMTDALLTLKEQEGLLKAAVEALKDLRSTLISLSANMRTEIGPNRMLRQQYQANART